VRRNNLDLLLVSVVALAAVAVTALLSSGSNLIRAALSVPLVLFLPGYALSAALLPDGRTGLAERIALGAGLSISIAVLGGLILNLLPSGLTVDSWRALLLGVTLACAAYALWRREARRVPGPGPLVTQVSFREAALVSSAALLIGLALGVGAIGLNPTASNAPQNSSFTQFWALPQRSGQQYRVLIGLHNYEDQPVTYRVTLESSGNVFAEWPQITVGNGESWQAQAAVPPYLANAEVVANAYRSGLSTPYRHVRLAPQNGSGG
jgi:uncharacterized membrane protein